MADKTAIEWTDATWNPIRARSKATGKVGWWCAHASPGCINCYAETMNGWIGNHVPFTAQARDKVEIFLDEKILRDPPRWRRPRKIFPGSMTDLFGDFVPRPMLARMFAVMGLAGDHTFQVVTKRGERMAETIADDRFADLVDHEMNEIAPAAWCDRELQDAGGWPLRNVWLGVSVEDQRRADERRDSLAAIAAMGATTWVSYEPALTDVDWHGWEFLRWLVSGGESGPRARPSHPDWHRHARDWCAANRVAYLFKQWGNWSTTYDRDIDDPDWRNCPRPAGPRERYVNLAGGHGFHGDRVVFARDVGKKAAGRLLDGRTHDEFPQ